MQDDNTGKTGNSEGAGHSPKRKAEGLANTLRTERYYTPDRKAMLAALRVVLGLPKAPPRWIEELSR
jgi:hypothetical protein